MRTLKEVLEFLDEGLDIADDIFDWGNYFEYNLELSDYYDKVLDFMANEIEFVKYHKGWYSICKITDFIQKYQDKFDEFLNDVYQEEYTPRYFCENDGIEKIDVDDELFYDIYIEMFGSLINGGFSEKDYKKLYTILTRKEVK